MYEFYILWHNTTISISSAQTENFKLEQKRAAAPPCGQGTAASFRIQRRHGGFVANQQEGQGSNPSWSLHILI